MVNVLHPLSGRELGPLPPMSMHACMHKQEGRLENKKNLRIKDDIRQDRDGNAYSELLILESFTP